ncbi:helix-turn-helix transcriptional regulator [Streptococcus sp. ZJ100]|uniref:helix-turn-helix transcriptional regulator n=1 Tax=Streptococcus handemini TaxID=3161188 RepID=UPI0032EE3F5B
MTIAEKIKYILKVNYWTQPQLADKVGVTSNTISKWKRGYAISDGNSLKIKQLYNQARRLEYERSKPKPIPKPKTEGKVLSERGKIVLKFPWYSYQRK